MKEKDIPAFKSKLQLSGFEKPLQPTPKLHEFDGDNSFIVRKVENYQFEDKQFTTPEEVGLLLASLFNELREKYGVDAPASFVVAEDEHGEPSLYTLTEKIRKSGIATESLTENKRTVFAQSIIELFESLISYFEDKAESEENFLCDIPTLDQFVYGTKEGEKTERWHLVDTDPYFTDRREALYGTVDTFLIELFEIQEKYNINLQDVINRAKDLMSSLDSEESK